MQAVGGAENLLLPSKRRARVALLDVGVVICGRERKLNPSEVKRGEAT